MKDMIEPFDYEKAKTGNYKIQTVGGCSVRILCYDRKFDTRKLTDNPTTIVALVEAKNSYGGERCFLYRQDGTCIQPSTNERCGHDENNLVLGDRNEDKPIAEKLKSFTDNERQNIVKLLFENAERFIEANNKALNSFLVTAQIALQTQLDEITNHREEKK